MNLLLQQLLAGALVIACALFSAWRLSSVRLRLRALDILAELPLSHRASWLARLRERTLAQQLRACGGCGSATRAGPQPTLGEDAPNRTPGALRR